MTRLRLPQNLLVAVVLFCIGGTTFAGIPGVVNYQGRLTDLAGNAVADGNYQAKFIIYGSPSGTDSLWSSGFQTIMVSNGLFNYLLGSSVALPANLFSASPARYLGITVGTDEEITPRVQFVTVPYASQTQNADHAEVSEDALALAGETPEFYLTWADMIGVPPGFADDIDNVDTDWNHLINVPAGFADGVDNIGIPYIELYAGNGLTGGGQGAQLQVDAVPGSGLAVAADFIYIPVNGVMASHLATNSVGSLEIIDQAIVDADISDAAAIGVSKISGTAVNLSSTQTITGFKRFDGTVYFSDSTMKVNSSGVTIGNTYNSEIVFQDRTRVLSARRKVYCLQMITKEGH